MCGILIAGDNNGSQKVVDSETTIHEKEQYTRHNHTVPSRMEPEIPIEFNKERVSDIKFERLQSLLVILNHSKKKTKQNQNTISEKTSTYK